MDDDEESDTEELAAMRPSLASYRASMIAELQSITSSGTVISNALYTVLRSPTPWLMLTMPFVLYGVFRYVYLVDRGDGAAPDGLLVRDKQILLTVACYAITALRVLIFAPKQIALWPYLGGAASSCGHHWTPRPRLHRSSVPPFSSSG